MTQKIMIVDDNASDLASMKQLLEKEGYTVDGFDEGASALDAMEDGGYVLALIDLQMPVLSGYDLLQLIKQKDVNGVKLAFVSVVPKSKVSMEGVDGFIQKPFSEDEFVKQVKKIIGE